MFQCTQTSMHIDCKVHVWPRHYRRVGQSCVVAPMPERTRMQVRMQADAELLRSAQKVQKKRAPMPDWAGAGGAEEVGAFTVTGAAANRMHKRSPPKLDPNDPEVLVRNRPSIPAQAHLSQTLNIQFDVPFSLEYGIVDGLTTHRFQEW